MASSLYQSYQEDLQQVLDSADYIAARQAYLGGYTPTAAQTTALNRAQALQSTLDSAKTSGLIGGAEESPQDRQRLEELLAQFETAQQTGNAANESRYQDLLTGYQGRADQSASSLGQVAGQYGTMATNQQNALSGVTQGYANRESQLGGLFTGLGDRARADIGQAYGAQRAGAEQDMAARGLGNTTIRNSVMGGIGQREAADLSRLNEQLRHEQIGYQSQWGTDTLGAQERASGLNYQAGLQGAQFGERAASTAAGLSGDKLGVIERRTDTAPSLQDVANLSLQLGKSAANRNVLPIASSLYGQYSQQAM